MVVLGFGQAGDQGVGERRNGAPPGDQRRARVGVLEVWVDRRLDATSS
jgi:hypothetical protein